MNSRLSSARWPWWSPTMLWLPRSVFILADSSTLDRWLWRSLLHIVSAPNSSLLNITTITVWERWNRSSLRPEISRFELHHAFNYLYSSFKKFLSHFWIDILAIRWESFTVQRIILVNYLYLSSTQNISLTSFDRNPRNKMRKFHCSAYIISVEISRRGWRYSDAAIDHGRQPSQVPQPRPPSVPRHHFRSLPGSQTSDAGLWNPQRRHRRDLHKNESSVHTFLPRENPAGDVIELNIRATSENYNDKNKINIILFSGGQGIENSWFPSFWLITKAEFCFELFTDLWDDDCSTRFHDRGWAVRWENECISSPGWSLGENSWKSLFWASCCKIMIVHHFLLLGFRLMQSSSSWFQHFIYSSIQSINSCIESFIRSLIYWTLYALILPFDKQFMHWIHSLLNW